MKTIYKLPFNLPFFILVSFFYVCNCSSVHAQFIPENQTQLLDSLLLAFPNEDIILLENHTTISPSLAKGKARYNKTESESYMIIRESGINKFQKVELPIYSDDKFVRSTSYSIDVNGKRHIAGFSGISDRVSESFVFYDGGRIAKFEFPKLSVGSVVYYSLEVSNDSPELPTIHLVSDYQQSLKSKLTINCPNTINYKLLPFNLDSIKVTENITDKNTIKTVEWDFKNIGSYNYESSGNGALHLLPHVYFVIESIVVNDQVQKLNGELAELTSIYEYNVQNVILSTPSEELVSLTREITAPFEGEVEKVKAIYYWVQQNIRYIAFEAGRDGFVPRLPSEILSKRYGDCKDMASIIYGMTSAIGINTNLTWVGTRDLPYKYAESPYVFVDNHMIATYNSNDTIYVLDATSSYQPWGIPTSMIQSKELLIRTKPNEFKVWNVPVYKAPCTIIDTTYIELNGTNLQGKSKVEFNGYSKIDLHYSLAYAENTQEKATNLVNQLSRNTSGMNATITSILNDTERDKSTTVNYDFNISKFAISAGSNTFISLFLDPKELLYFEPKARRSSYELDYLQTNRHVVRFTVPTGLKYKQLPAPILFENEIARFAITYSNLPNNQIQCEYTIENKTLLISPEQFSSYAELVDVIKKASNQKISLINQ